MSLHTPMPAKATMPPDSLAEPAREHPRRDDDGQRVLIERPSAPTPLEAWATPSASACVVPGGPMPAALNGVAFLSWRGVQTDAEWEALAAIHQIEEPALGTLDSYKNAAGVVLREPDGRIWLVAPSNAYGGYLATFPKGTMGGKSAQATALAEAFEESGLRVRLVRHLVDIKRSQSYTRYYVAERIGGSPSDMGWESQAVMLVPPAELMKFLNSPYDRAVLEKLGTDPEPGWNRNT